MPYTADTAPDAVQKLPKGARDIWIAAYNSAFEQYDGDEGKAAATAWAAVKKKYEKGSDGKWHPKKEATMFSLLRLAADALKSLQRGKDPTALSEVQRRALSISWMADDKQRALAASLMFDQIYAALAAYQPQDEWATTGWVRIIDLYVDNAATYLIVAREGKLYRIDLTITGDTVTLGQMLNVTELFQPVQQMRVQVVRAADGTARWIAKAATAVLNRSGEIDSIRLFDSFVQHAKDTGEYPVLDFFHLGNRLRMGGADYLARDKAVYIALGVFDDTELGRAAAKGLEEQGDYWGTSISFLPTAEPDMVEIADGIKVPVYTRGVNRFISILQESVAASLFTTIGVQEVDRMDKRIQEEIEKLFGKKIADEFAASVDSTNRTIDEQQLISRQALGAAAVPDKPTVPAPAPDPALHSNPAATAAAGAAPAAARQDPPAGDPDKSREFVLDDAAVKAIAAVVTKDLEARLKAIEDAFKPSMEQVSQMLPALEKVKTDFAAAQERIKQLEATDEEKHKQWLSDLPPRDRVVVTRPSTEHAGAATDEVDAASTASATLATLKTHATPAGK